MSGWTDAPMIFIPRACCPSCGHTRYIAIRSMPPEFDGSRTLRAVCKRCSERFLIVTELGDLPSYGSGRFSDDTLDVEI